MHLHRICICIALTSAAEGFLYGVVNQGTGDVKPDDSSVFRIDPSTWAVTHQLKIAFTDPAGHR